MKQKRLPVDGSRYARDQVAMKEYVKLINEDTGEWRLPGAAAEEAAPARRRYRSRAK
jgi:hypothetical protein